MVWWAATHLRAPAVVAVTVSALAADGLTLFLLLPPADALTDVAFFGAVLAVMAVLLTRSIRVQETAGRRAPRAAHRRRADRPHDPPGVRPGARRCAAPPGAGRHGAGAHRRRLVQDDQRQPRPPRRRRRPDSTFDEIIDLGDRVVILLRDHGRRKDMETEVELFGATVLTFREGKIARWEDYANRAAALEAVGLSEQDAHADS